MESPPTFAGVLAAITAPVRTLPPATDLDGLEDDVATFSYERALRAHSRFRTTDSSDRALTEPSNPNIRIVEALPADLEPAAETMPRPAEVPSIAEAESESADDASTAPDRNLKSARITMWLSNAESAQLRARAAEAGLTVSAYLRSCTVEAESLRAQVRDTMAQLRGEATNENQGSTPSARRSWFRRLRFWPRAQGSRGIAQV
jgi:hypothetical protein